MYSCIHRPLAGQGAVSDAFAVGAVGEPADEGCEGIVRDAFFRGADIVSGTQGKEWHCLASDNKVFKRGSLMEQV